MRAKTLGKIWSILSTIALLPVLLRGAFDSKWRAALGQRLLLGGTKDISKKRGAIWVHAASMGEVRGAAPVVRGIAERYPEHSIVVTTTSLTGQAEAAKLVGADAAWLLPLDHPYCVAKFLNALQPQLLLIAETEIWPALLLAVQDRRIATMLFNGRISDLSLPRYLKLRWALKPLLEAFRSLLTQSEVDRNRFVQLGAVAERVSVAGSSKYDSSVSLVGAAERVLLLQSLGLVADRPIFVAGSVRPVEDQQVIDAFKRLRAEFSSLQLIIAPRHPECFDDAAATLKNSGLKFVRRSERQAAGDGVLLLDTVGELSKIYSLGTIAFIGGTLVKIGGHNPLEPAAYNVPVMFGPNYSNVREVGDELVRSGGGVVVADSDSIFNAATKWLSDARACESAGAAAHSVWQAQQGATERVLAAVAQLLAVNTVVSRDVAQR